MCLNTLCQAQVLPISDACLAHISSIISFITVRHTPNCNNVVIEKKQKAKKPNRNKLAMGFTFAYFNSVFNNYLRIHSQQQEIIL